MSPNEARKLENLNPRDDGDVYFYPANMVPNNGPAPQNPPDTSKGGNNDADTST